MTATDAGERPNVLWILCDELRADALSCDAEAWPGIATPNIDRLAAEGTLFERAYAASPVCVPSRVSMLTGTLPHKTGVYGNEAKAGHYPPFAAPQTFPERFSEAGWATRTYGKSHVPDALQPWQEEDRVGFSMEEVEEGVDGATRVRTPGTRHTVGGLWTADRPYPPEALTARVLERLPELPRPFLARASFLQPHTPVVVPEPWASRYCDLRFVRPGARPDASAFERRLGEIVGGAEMSDAEFQRAAEVYHGAVAWVDEQVGRILDALDDSGLADETIVVFTADHGAHLGEDGAYGKQSFAPQSHRVPLLFRWPGRIPARERRTDLAHGVDLSRTLVGLAGVAAPPGAGGRDLFRDPAPSHLISSIGYGAAASRAFPNLGVGTAADGGGWPQRYCVRTPRFRLDLTTRLDGRPALPEERDVFLADRDRDPGERCNVAALSEYAAVVEKLTAISLDAFAGAVQPDDDAVYLGFVPPSPPPVG